jgi:hypothetical protein
MTLVAIRRAWHEFRTAWNLAMRGEKAKVRAQEEEILRAIKAVEVLASLHDRGMDLGDRLLDSLHERDHWTMAEQQETLAFIQDVCREAYIVYKPLKGPRWNASSADVASYWRTTSTRTVNS